MDNRRFFLFILTSFSFLWLYTTFIAPKFFPPPKPVPADVNNVDANDAGNAAGTDEQPQQAASDTGDSPAEAPDTDKAADPGSIAADASPEPEIHPHTSVQLGSLDPASGYFLRVELSSAGAVIESVQLTDPKFRELTRQDEQVTVIGTNSTTDRTFSMAVDAIDNQLLPFQMSLETADWELVASTDDSATFAFVAPDRSLRVQKTFHLPRIDGTPEALRNAFHEVSAGYTIEVSVAVQNLADRRTSIAYELQGPVGILLENAEHTRKHRDIKVEFVGDKKDVTLAATAVQKLYAKYRDKASDAGKLLTDVQILPMLRENDQWTGVFRYAGVDVQFFAALVSPIDERPLEERLAEKWIDRTYPMMVQEDRRRKELSDISFRMASTPVALSPAGTPQDTVTHRFALFVGPKYRELLDAPPFEADSVLDYGTWFGFIARGMHALLNSLHKAGLPYFLAIVCLTVIVRGCLFPLSRKQAISAAKMKDLQPKINELKLKYGDDKEKMAKAQMELWRKHKINPLGGCLPLFLQFPVFIGLYTCLNTAVDLRLSRFLWIDNLAAPDSLFRMPFSLPFLGQDFNLLPCITVVLFLMQQKMFMPPPADEQQEVQQKMMNMMTLFFGVMFWHVPAGLCIYFIASSLWGIAERQLLGSTSSSTSTDADGTANEDEYVDPLAGDDSPKRVVQAGNRKAGNGAGNPQPARPPKVGFMQRLVEAAEQAQKQAEKSRKLETRGKKKKR
ncbi:MAG: membrane protein insertase YidC [Planctomycetaceae bacterium]